MRHHLRPVLSAAAVLSLLAPAAQAGTRFDGTWSVEVITEKGECDRAYRYPIAIEEGRVRYAGYIPVSVSGSVNGSGAVNGSISHGSTTAHVVGSLAAGGSGGGTWSMSGGRSCSGRWTGERRS